MVNIEMVSASYDTALTAGQKAKFKITSNVKTGKRADDLVKKTYLSGNIIVESHF